MDYLDDEVQDNESSSRPEDLTITQAVVVAAGALLVAFVFLLAAGFIHWLCSLVGGSP